MLAEFTVRINFPDATEYEQRDQHAAIIDPEHGRTAVSIELNPEFAERFNVTGMGEVAPLSEKKRITKGSYDPFGRRQL
jgi:hypothetical protein